MVFAIETQRAAHVNMTDTSGHIACNLTSKENRREGGDRYTQTRKPFQDKRSLICTNCCKPGHSQDTCFQLHGIPDWYKSLNDKRNKGPTNRGLVANVEDKVTETTVASTQNMTEMMFELLKLMRTHNLPSDPLTNCANFVNFDEEFAVLQEPRSFSKAVKHEEWMDAMKVEIEALEHNNTWKLTPLPNGKTAIRAIGCKRVYKTKLHVDGFVERYKARPIAKGFNQIEGVDYTDSFSPVAKTVTVHLFLALAAAHGWPLQQLDVNNAFLHGYLDEDPYMTPPKRYPAASGMDIGDARYFLDLEIAWNSTGIYVAQTKYVADIFNDTGLVQDKSVCFTLPDISHLVPCEDHWRAALHVVRYLKGTPSKGLFLPAQSSFALTVYCNADWASCTDSRRSLTGFCIFLGDALVLWKTKKQSKVSRSTTEAEYRSMVATVCELHWISYILSDLGISLSLPVELFCDNRATLHIVANPVFHERMKHIELDCHIVHDAYKDGFTNPTYVRDGVLELQQQQEQGSVSRVVILDVG
ncbi:UNVERIFIED_CONTAM: Retrovirus-related Pol polyprotein from transposon RE2 [Sesamum latifolium]|uniref:Retrovirus-related Pol polyprotein from transposon RE2 n=1 Tax=Sesamum latifolium TaxID=2727402 RepID=A0AAW2WTE6_9LAMI